MRSTWISLAKFAPAMALALALPGLAVHGLSAGGPRPARSEFGLGPRRSATGAYVATLVPARPLSGRGVQRIELRLTDSTSTPVDGATIAVAGAMPEHHHGMPTQPRITTALGDGRYLVDGVRFSMPAWWTLTFVVDAAAGRDSVTFNLKL